MLNANALHLRPDHAKLTEALRGTQLSQLVLFDCESAAIGLGVDARFENELLVNESIEMEDSGCGVHLHTFDVLTFAVEEARVIVVYFFDWRALDVRNRLMVAGEHFGLRQFGKVRIGNDTFKHRNRALECVLVANVEDEVEIGYLSCLVAISLEVEESRGGVEPRESRNEIRLIHV